MSTNSVTDVDGEGGGIHNTGSATLTVTNATITANSASAGAGVRNTGVAALHNTIVTANLLDDVSGVFDSESSYNLIGIIEGSDGLDVGPDSQFGTEGAPLDVMLGPLDYNGGPELSRSHAILPGSPALDRGSNARAIDAELLTDQRGFDRFVDGRGNGVATVDVGAFEVQSVILGTIRGTVFHDFDGDGGRQLGDQGLGGWTVFLDTNQNRQLDPGETATTADDEGRYEFSGLTPGEYTVSQVMPWGWQTDVSAQHLAGFGRKRSTPKQHRLWRSSTPGSR